MRDLNYILHPGARRSASSSARRPPLRLRRMTVAPRLINALDSAFFDSLNQMIDFGRLLLLDMLTIMISFPLLLIRTEAVATKAGSADILSVLGSWPLSRQAKMPAFPASPAVESECSAGSSSTFLN